MPRPSRSWVRKTYTVSPVVENVIRRYAAAQGIPEGTLVDSIVWRALVKPDETRLKVGGFTDEELERIFAEEVLEHLGDDRSISSLFDEITLEDKNEVEIKGNARLCTIDAILKRWRTTRMIDKQYQVKAKEFLSNLGIIPKIFLQGLVDEEWFTP